MCGNCRPADADAGATVVGDDAIVGAVAIGVGGADGATDAGASDVASGSTGALGAGNPGGGGNDSDVFGSDSLMSNSVPLPP